MLLRIPLVMQTVGARVGEVAGHDGGECSMSVGRAAVRCRAYVSLT